MKNNKAKLLGLALSTSFVLSSLAPAVANASSEEENQTTTYAAEKSAESVSPNTVNDLLEKANNLKDLISSTESPLKSPLLNAIDKIMEALGKIDYTTGGPRVELASDSLEAILVATRDLTTKTESVHRDIGFKITKAVIVMSDPFSSQKRIEKASQDLKAALDKAQQSPDLTENDIATVYVKEELREVIKEARKAKGIKELTKEQRKELVEAIRKAVHTKNKNRVTVAEINQATDELKEYLDNMVIGEVEEEAEQPTNPENEEVIDPEFSHVDVEDEDKKAIEEEDSTKEETNDQENEEVVETIPEEIINK